MQKSEHGRKKLEISFGGCGFLGVYHAGVGQCVAEHAPHLFGEFSTYYGASAGAITAVCAACRCDPIEAYKWVKKTFEASRKHRLGMLHPSFDLYARLRAFLEDFLPKNAHRLCRNRVKISLSCFSENGFPTNWLVTDFNTRKELINAIIASSFIPGYAGFRDCPKFRGRRCFDGGFTSNIPCVSEPDVITVSPFSGTCDISPQGESCSPYMVHVCDQPLQLSFKNIHRLLKSLCPTSWDELESLFYRGYEDGKRFFTNEGFFVDPVVEPSKSSSQISPVEDTPSEYYSVGSHSRSQSIAVSVSAEFLSCIDEDEDNEAELDLELASLKRRPSTLFFEVEEPEAEIEKTWWDRRPSVSSVLLKPPVSVAKLSLKSISWLTQKCYPSQLPIVSGLYEKINSPSSDEHTWENQLIDGHTGVIGSVLTSLTGSMVTF